MGALVACAAAGNFYSRGYLKAVTEAREAVEKARRTAQRLGAAETRDVPVPTTGVGPTVPPQLAQLEEIMSAARRGASRSNPALIETLRAAESEQLGIQHEMQRSIEENLRLAAEHNVRRVSERLAAARLATERNRATAEGNTRLVEALLEAEEAHAIAEERAARSAEEATNIVSGKRARLDAALQTAPLLAAAREEVERRASKDAARLRVFLRALITPTLPGDRASYQTLLVLLPIGSALICLCVVIELYIRTVGIIAITFVGLLALAIFETSYLTWLILNLKPIFRLLKANQPESNGRV